MPLRQSPDGSCCRGDAKQIGAAGEPGDVEVAAGAVAEGLARHERPVRGVGQQPAAHRETRGVGERAPEVAALDEGGIDAGHVFVDTQVDRLCGGEAAGLGHAVVILRSGDDRRSSVDGRIVTVERHLVAARIKIGGVGAIGLDRDEPVHRPAGRRVIDLHVGGICVGRRFGDSPRDGRHRRQLRVHCHGGRLALDADLHRQPALWAEAAKVIVGLGEVRTMVCGQERVGIGAGGHRDRVVPGAVGERPVDVVELDRVRAPSVHVDFHVGEPGPCDTGHRAGDLLIRGLCRRHQPEHHHNCRRYGDERSITRTSHALIVAESRFEPVLSMRRRRGHLYWSPRAIHMF